MHYKLGDTGTAEPVEDGYQIELKPISIGRILWSEECS
jgi:hypothetical protein